MALKKEITVKIRDLLRQNPQGLNITAIVHNININRNTAGRYLENLMVSGQVEMRRFGMAKIYRLAKRVPLSAMLSISSELIMLLDSSMRVVYANDPLLQFCGTTREEFYGKNIEYTSCVPAFDDVFDSLKKQIRAGISGKEWYGELPLQQKGVVFACRIAPAVFEEGQGGVSVLLENITERKQAEQALRESEATARALINAPTDSVILLDPEGIILAVNETAALRIGRRQEDLTGVLADTVFPKEIARARRSMISRVVDQKTSVRFEDERNGMWFDTVAYPVTDEAGDVKRVAIIARDITDRMRTEEALRESEDRYRSLVEISPDPVILHRNGKILYMNPAAFSLIGASPSDAVIGKDILDFIHPGFRDVVRNNIQKDIQGNRTPPMELSMLRIDGTEVIVEGRGVGTIIDGKPAVQVAIRDITGRRQAEQVLKESEAQYRSLAEASQDIIYMVDRDDIVTYVNSFAAAMLGKDPGAVIGQARASLFPPELAARQAAGLRWVFASRQPARSDGPMPVSGEVRWFDHFLVPVPDATGRVISVLGVSRDITGRKETEEALRQSEGKLHAMLQSMTDPMSMMGGDLTIIWANDTAKRYFGADIVGRKCYEAFHQRKEPCEPSPCLTLKAFQDGKMHRHETTVIDREGTTRFFDCTANVALRDEQGRPTAVLEISRDITKSKQAEGALRTQS